MKRYHYDSDGLWEKDNGTVVLYQDAAALEQRAERAEAELDSIRPLLTHANGNLYAGDTLAEQVSEAIACADYNPHEIAALRNEVDKLKAERDEARRELTDIRVG